MHDTLFRMLADPSRRKVIDALRHGEQAVQHIVELVEIHQSGVSRHLGILAAEGFVEVRADGARRLYSLRPERFRELAMWLGRYRRAWERRELKRRDRRSGPRGSTRSLKAT